MEGKIKIAEDANGHLYKIEEWKNLRDEISRKQQLNYRIIFSTLGLNFFLYSYILVQKQEHVWMDAFIALLPAFFVGIAHFWHLKNEHSALRITIYLRYFIETNQSNPFNWETTLRNIINRALDKKRSELFVRYFRGKGLIKSIVSFLKRVWSNLIEIWKVIYYFTGIPLLSRNSNKIPREVNLVLYPFYYISPLISAFILIQIKSPNTLPGWLPDNFFLILLIFFGFSLLIYSIWALTIIRIGNREIQILNKVSEDIEKKGLKTWKEEINQWAKANSEME